MAKIESFRAGDFHLATCSSEILRDLFCAMHGVPTPDGQVPSEHALRLYNAVSDELVAHIAIDSLARQTNSGPGFHYEGTKHDGTKWVIILEGENMAPAYRAPLFHDGPKEDAIKAANTEAQRAHADRFIVMPHFVAAEAQL